MDQYSAENNNQHFVCPISMDVLKDPYFLQCGHVFEKNYIVGHFRFNNNRCPLCGQVSENLPKKLYIHQQAFPPESSQYASSEPRSQQVNIDVLIQEAKKKHEEFNLQIKQKQQSQKMQIKGQLEKSNISELSQFTDSPSNSPKRQTQQQYWNSKRFQDDIFKEYADNGKLKEQSADNQDKDYLESVDSDEIREIQRQYDEEKLGMRLKTESKNLYTSEIEIKQSQIASQIKFDDFKSSDLNDIRQEKQVKTQSNISKYITTPYGMLQKNQSQDIHSIKDNKWNKNKKQNDKMGYKFQELQTQQIVPTRDLSDHLSDKKIEQIIQKVINEPIKSINPMKQIKHYPNGDQFQGEFQNNLRHGKLFNICNQETSYFN